MTNRIDECFERLRRSQSSAFIAFITAGDPNFNQSLNVVKALIDAGTDIIELGIPFSDPLADGAVIQAAAGRALENGMTTIRVLELVRQIRTFSEIPIVLFTYLNPVFNYGFESFHADAARAGADGVLLLDLPPDEALQNNDLSSEQAHSEQLRQIRLIAPTSPEERIKMIAEQAQGFIYYVSREGVTGTQTTLVGGIAEQEMRIKTYAKVPVAVGFGISTPEQARTVAGLADGVVIGSAIVKVIAEHGDQPNLGEKVFDFVKPLVEATKSV